MSCWKERRVGGSENWESNTAETILRPLPLPIWYVRKKGEEEVAGTATTHAAFHEGGPFPGVCSSCLAEAPSIGQQLWERCSASGWPWVDQRREVAAWVHVPFCLCAQCSLSLLKTCRKAIKNGDMKHGFENQMIPDTPRSDVFNLFHKEKDSV